MRLSSLIMKDKCHKKPHKDLAMIETCCPKHQWWSYLLSGKWDVLPIQKEFQDTEITQKNTKITNMESTKTQA